MNHCYDKYGRELQVNDNVMAAGDKNNSVVINKYTNNMVLIFDGTKNTAVNAATLCYVPMTKIAATGHRPNKLWGYSYNEAHYIALKDIFKQHILTALNASNDKCVEVISGMALGVDTIIALAAIELKQEGYGCDVRLLAAVPFKWQECKWSKASVDMYNYILKWADSVVYVCDEGYAAFKMQKRNEYMVDRLTGPDDKLIAVWDGTSGGTANCVNYAVKNNKQIIYVKPADIKIL